MPACFILGAGPFYGLPVRPAQGDLILAADGGYRHCVQVGLTPDLLLGDFDSYGRAPLPAKVETLRYPAEKDDTDTMLALKLGFARGYRTFHLYGGTGGRMDHTLANLQALAYLARRGSRGYLYSADTVFTALQENSLRLGAQTAGIFSVFAWGGPARGVSILGGQYTLEDGAISPDFPLGVSNHFVGLPVEISVREGCLLVCWPLPAA